MLNTLKAEIGNKSEGKICILKGRIAEIQRNSLAFTCGIGELDHPELLVTHLWLPSTNLSNPEVQTRYAFMANLGLIGRFGIFCVAAKAEH